MDPDTPYMGLHVVSSIMRFCGICLMILAPVHGIFEGSSRNVASGLVIAIGGIVTGLLNVAGGEALKALRDIAINSAKWGGVTTHVAPQPAAAREEPDPDPDAPLLLRHPPGSVEVDEDAAVEMVMASNGARLVTCGHCGKKIKIAANSRFQPGSIARCPGCEKSIRV